MICTEAFPFITEFIDEIDTQLCKADPTYKLSMCQKLWIAHCIVGILVTGTLCWRRFEQYSLGKYSEAALSWIFRKSRIFWAGLLFSAVSIILKKYSLLSGNLVIDDSDRKRSKSTSKIAFVHKVYDKKTGGYFMGQNIVFLLLVTDKVTIPVGFKFYCPDPQKKAWIEQDKKLRALKVPKAQRPPEPVANPLFPTKIELGVQLLSEFKQHFADFKVQFISADTAYGSRDFFQKVTHLFPNTQIISQLKNNQKVIYQNQTMSVSEFFSRTTAKSTEIKIRGGEAQVVTLATASLKVEAHKRILRVVALKYDGEKEFRYIVASDLSWRAEDIVQAYTMRWLVEVFIEDWKGNEGWGKLALQTGNEGAFRGVLLSLLVDLCLLYHPNQFARIKNKQPACTVGSLREQLKNESLLTCFQEILYSESPMERFAALKEKFTEYFVFRDSKKHLGNRILPKFEADRLLVKKYGKLEVYYT